MAAQRTQRSGAAIALSSLSFPMPYSARFVLSLCVLLLIIGTDQALAQKGASLLSYRLHPGDSVVYRVHAVDSIGLYDVQRRIITRERIGIVSYRCDSVLPDGSYVMTWRYHAYNSTERLNSGPTVSRETHPWVGRSATFRMTAGGLRTTMFQWNSTSETSPGGPLEPLPLPWLGDDSLAPEIPGTTSYSGKNWLFENSFPPTLFDGIMMRVTDGATDTVGRRVLPVELNLAGTIAYASKQGEDSILTQAFVQSGGSYMLGVKEGYPLAGRVQQIARLKLHIGNERQQRDIEGRHSMTTVFELLWPKPLPSVAPKSRRGASQPKRSSRSR